MASIQQERMSQLLLEEIKAIIEQDLQDPVLDSVQVWKVKVGADRRNAKIFVYHQDPAYSRGQVLQALNRAKNYCRHQLTYRNVIGRVPDCHFTYSDAERAAAQVQDLLDSLELEPDGP